MKTTPAIIAALTLHIGTLMAEPQKSADFASISTSTAQLTDLGKRVDDTLDQVGQTDNQSRISHGNSPASEQASLTLKDPTQVNSDFKAKLRQLKSGHQEKEAIATVVQIPDIALLARLKPRNKKIAALFEIEGRKMILSRGEFATFIQNNQIKELHVDDLTNSLAELRIMPDDKIIRLH